jgi:hypothetical protein
MISTPRASDRVALRVSEVVAGKGRGGPAEGSEWVGSRHFRRDRNANARLASSARALESLTRSRFGPQGSRQAVEGTRDGGDGSWERPECRLRGQTEKRRQGISCELRGHGCRRQELRHYGGKRGGFGCHRQGAPIKLPWKVRLANGLRHGCAPHPGVDPRTAHPAREEAASLGLAMEGTPLDLASPGSPEGSEPVLRKVETLSVSA